MFLTFSKLFSLCRARAARFSHRCSKPLVCPNCSMSFSISEIQSSAGEWCECRLEFWESAALDVEPGVGVAWRKSPSTSAQCCITSLTFETRNDGPLASRRSSSKAALPLPLQHLQVPTLITGPGVFSTFSGTCGEVGEPNEPNEPTDQRKSKTELGLFNSPSTGLLKISPSIVRAPGPARQHKFEPHYVAIVKLHETCMKLRHKSYALFSTCWDTSWVIMRLWLYIFRPFSQRCRNCGHNSVGNEVVVKVRLLLHLTSDS